MDAVYIALGIPAAAVAVCAAMARVLIFVYALRGTDPKDRPAIIRALGRMHKDSRPELPQLGRRGSGSSAITDERNS